MSQNEDVRGEAAPEKLQAERGLSSVNARRKGGNVGKIAGIVGLSLVAMLMIWMQIAPKRPAEKPEKQVTETRRGLPALEIKDEPPPPPPPAVPPPATITPAAGPGAPQDTKPKGPTEAELLLMRRQRAPILAFTGGSTSNAGGGSAAGEGPAGSGGPGLLGEDDEEGRPDTSVGGQLQASKTEAVGAVMLPNRNYLVAKGTFLDCALITALDSTLPGMTSCRLTRNIYSDNGKVLLLERGSIVEGEYRSGQMRQGMNRIFVLWTRVRTPNGVAVRLDSPGTDELGRSGLKGWVNTHFWKRYGSALMLSLVDAGTEYAIAQQRSQGQGGDSISLDGPGNATQQAAAIALQNSINIPPTLNKNQGDLVNIYVARDMDFRGVYALRSQ